jgi:glycosyltransferase involved in cell wall biosynthesis
MASIVLADTTRPYDGRSLAAEPLGATETSVIYLVRELAKRGHQVSVLTPCRLRIRHEGVSWIPLAEGAPPSCDLYIAAQHPELLGTVRHAKRRALWVLWQPNHLDHYRRILQMWRYQPVPVLISDFQTQIFSAFPPHLNPLGAHSPPPPPGTTRSEILAHPVASLRRLAKLWAAAALLAAPERHIVIPLGIPDDVRGRVPLPCAPARRAIFASHPQRNLRKLVEIWASSILPRLPDATLDVYGVHDLGERDGWQTWEGRFLPAGMSAAVKASVRIHRTATREALHDAMRAARVMLYPGHECEAFCMSLAEAQALGLPAVISPVAAVSERVIDGRTGFHRTDPASFAEAAVSLLSDDRLWETQHRACLELCQGVTWVEVAARFEAALLDDSFPAYPNPPEGR